MMPRALLFLLLCAASSPVRGADAPDPDAWAAAFFAKAGAMKGAAYPETVALLQEKGGKSVALDVSADDVEASIYLEVKDPDSVGLFLALNRDLPLAKGASGEAQLKSATDTDLVLVASAAKLTLLKRDAKGALASVHETASKAAPTAKSVSAFLFDALRYNAVAIEQKGDLLLVKAPTIGKGRILQALLLKGSVGSWSMRGRPPGGDGLLQLIKAGERYAVFKVLVDPEDGAVAHGTKILLEGAP